MRQEKLFTFRDGQDYFPEGRPDSHEVRAEAQIEAFLVCAQEQRFRAFCSLWGLSLKAASGSVEVLTAF